MTVNKYGDEQVMSSLVEPQLRQKAAVRLTDRLALKAQAAAKRYVLWDSTKKGLGLRVEVSGRKSFILRYRAGGGGRNAPLREMVIGQLGNWTVDGARREAGRLLNAVDAGNDPAMDRRLKRQEINVEKLCELYLKDGVAHKKASTLESDRGRIARHIVPLIGKKLVTEVQTGDIRKLLRDVADGKTANVVKTKPRGKAIVTGGKTAANRTVGLLGGIFTFAVAEGYRTDNPVRGVKRYTDRSSQRFLSPAELNKLGEAIRTIANRVTMNGTEELRTNPVAIAIVRLLILTGARKSEIAGLRWKEVDFEHSYLRLADSKTGEKVVPIGSPALVILSELASESGNPQPEDFVFPSETGKTRFQGVEKVWRRIRKEAGMPELRMHDLRHSFASAGLIGNEALPIIGKLLGHADIGTTQRYAHLADDPLKKAADRISTSIAGALDGKTKANVVKLREVKK